MPTNLNKKNVQFLYVEKNSNPERKKKFFKFKTSQKTEFSRKLILIILCQCFEVFPCEIFFNFILPFKLRIQELKTIRVKNRLIHMRIFIALRNLFNFFLNRKTF